MKVTIPLIRNVAPSIVSNCVSRMYGNGIRLLRLASGSAPVDERDHVPIHVGAAEAVPHVRQVGGLDEEIVGQLPLDAEVPLLHHRAAVLLAEVLRGDQRALAELD